MVPEIDRKITELISLGISSESQAVHLLVLVRKLLETRSRDDYPYLNFHCDWVLHSRMNRVPAQRILSVFNEADQLLRTGATSRDLPDELKSKLENIFAMNHFKNELSAFLKERKLPQLDCVRDGWVKFIWHVANVIEDCPLEVSQNNATSTVKKVTIKTELASQRLEGEQFYKISWKITDLHGDSGELFVVNSFSVSAA